MSGQLTKEENLTSYRKNTVLIDKKLIASSELFALHKEITFYYEPMSIHLFFSLDNQEFKDIGNLVTTYIAKDRDMYSLSMRHGGSLYVSFEMVNDYLKIFIRVRLGNVDYDFPELNRLQYAKLFKG